MTTTLTTPAQALPDWLSYSSTPSISPTGFTVVNLPLTYFGPSIPLGSGWVYGGLTSPASSATTAEPTTKTPPPTATPSNPSTTATPPSTSSSPSGATSGLSTPSASASPSNSATAPNGGNSVTLQGSPSSTLAAHTSHSVSVGEIVGLVVGIVAFAFLLVFCVWLVVRRNRRRRLAGIRDGSFGDFVMIDPENYNRPSDQHPGSSRSYLQHSYEAAQSLLDGSDATDGMQERSPTARLVYAGSPDRMPPGRPSSGESTILEESPADSSNLFYVPRRNRHSTSLAEAVLQDEPLLPPPRLDPDAVTREANTPMSSQGSLGSELEERAQLLTADRVQLGGQQSWSYLPHGLGGLARLRRSSWFNRIQSDDPVGSRRQSYTSECVSSELGGRPRMRNMIETSAESRPISAHSARSAVSGGTVYHDAVSNLDDLSGPRASLGHGSPLPPPPYTPPHRHLEQNGSPDIAISVLPPDRVFNASRERLSTPGTPRDEQRDVLDESIPLPAASLHSSNSTRNSSLRFPPGLESYALSGPGVWRESRTSGHPSPASLGTDPLELDPPSAGEYWTHLRTSVSFDQDDRRYTFGQPPFQEFNLNRSQSGSLHSLRRGGLSAQASGSFSASGHTHSISGSRHSQNRSGDNSVNHSHSSSGSRGRTRRDANEPSSGSSNYIPSRGGRALLSAFGQFTPASSEVGDRQAGDSAPGSPHSATGSIPEHDIVPPLPSRVRSPKA